MLTARRLKILAITLARGGSKSVPRKNVKMLAGAPLISYTIVEALKSNLITRYVVSTDDDQIREVALAYGAEAPFKRPEYLATDEATSMKALQHTVSWVEKEENVQYDYVIELMCTNPMKTVRDIDAVLDKLISTGADSVIGITRLDDHHPLRAKKIIDDCLVDYCLPEVINSRRQDLKPEAYIRNGSIYAMRRDSLMLDNARYGTPNSRPYIMSSESSVNMDSWIDFKLAEILLSEKM